MIRANAKFIIYPGGAFDAAAQKKKITIVHQALDSQITKDTTPYVPFKTGVLSGSPLRGKRGVGEIVYDTPYARRLYYGTKFNFNRTFHPQAGSKWLLRAKAVWMKQWTQIVARLLGGQTR